jgi:hypothetical protein
MPLFPVPICIIRSGKTVPEKALTISEAVRFALRGDRGQLDAICMNQLCISWTY